MSKELNTSKIFSIRSRINMARERRPVTTLDLTTLLAEDADCLLHELNKARIREQEFINTLSIALHGLAACHGLFATDLPDRILDEHPCDLSGVTWTIDNTPEIAAIDNLLRHIKEEDTQ